MNEAARDLQSPSVFGLKKSSEWSDSTPVMNMYLRFCTDVSVDQDDPGNSMLKLILLMQKNVTIETAYRELFGTQFLDWDHVFLLKSDRNYSDSTTWVHLLNYVTVTIPDMPTLLRQHAVLLHYYICMQKAGLDIDATDFVSLYLLVNISRLESLRVFEQYFSIRRNSSVHQEGLLFFSQLANVQFEREDQTKALVYLLRSGCQIKAGVVKQELEIKQARSLELEGLFKQKQMRAVIGRPKLRSKLKARDAGGAVSMFQLDRLSNWSDAIRFPNVFSLTQKKRLYFLMSQVHLSPDHYVDALLPDQELSETILKYPVKSPDTDVIYDCIVGCKVTSEPFSELHQFRAECFHSFAQEQKTRLRLNDLLHLYISSYQNPAIWKTVWKLVFPVLSIQIIRDVESFVERVPFAHNSVVSLMFGKSQDEARRNYPSRAPSMISSRAMSPSSRAMSPSSRAMSPSSRATSPSSQASRAQSPTGTEFSGYSSVMIPQPREIPLAIAEPKPDCKPLLAEADAFLQTMSEFTPLTRPWAQLLEPAPSSPSSAPSSPAPGAADETPRSEGCSAAPAPPHTTDGPDAGH